MQQPTLIEVAADLVRQFRDLPQTTVVRILTDCLREHPSSGPVAVQGLTEDRLIRLRREQSR